MPCSICGRPQGPKCEGGQVRYIAGLFPCALKAGILAGPPIIHNPQVIAPAPDDNLWVIEPEPSAAGLEDLL